MSSLRHKLIKGAIWNTIAQVGTFVCNFVLTFVLARLLEPGDFGLLGMVMVIAGLLGYFSEFGLIDSLIRKKDHDELDENTVFWAGLFISVLTYGVIYFISPLISVFYGDPQLTAISRVASLVYIIGSYGFVPVAIETKKLRYSIITIVELASMLISGSIAMLIAYNGGGVWALVAQMLFRDLIRNMGYFLCIGWKPRFAFSALRFKEMSGFGMHRTFTNLIKAFSETIDKILIGKMLGPTPLGYYTMAVRLTRFPVEKIMSVFGKMLFPAFSQMQKDKIRIKRNYWKITFLGGLLLLPFVIILMFATETLIHWTIGEKWMPICGLIRILAVYLLLLSVTVADEPLMMLFHIKFLNMVKFLQAIVLLIGGIFVLLRYDIIAMAWLVVACHLLCSIAIKIKILNLLECGKEKME